jgi:hypothetical protein
MADVAPPLPLALDARHLAHAQLYANRTAQVAGLHARGLVPAGGRVIEMGVAFGDFSLRLIQMLQPSLFVGVDIFLMHQLSEAWGRPVTDVMGALNHRQFYEKRLAREASDTRVIVREGNSWDEVARLEEDDFDLIYIDALHTYDAVKKDAEAAVAKCGPNGVIIFNDYTMMNYKNLKPYGVIQVANQMVVEGGWRVVGLALSAQMYCDIAIARA